MRHTSAALRIHGHEIIGPQISQPCNATEIGLDAAIGSTGGDGGAKIGVAPLHGDETTLLGATKNARVVGDGLYGLTFFSC